MSCSSSLAATFPDVLIAETQKLEFHVSTPSVKGSLHAQVGGALDELLRKNRGAVIVKLRVFASQSDLVVASDDIAKWFIAKKRQLPVVVLLGVAGFPEQGQLVEIESTASGTERVNREGLAFLAGLASPTGERTIAGLARVSKESGVAPEHVLRISCFYESLDMVAGARTAIAATFPAAEASFVHSFAAAPNPLIECEAVARMTTASAERIRYFNFANSPPSPNFSRAALVTAPRLAFLEMQDASGESDTDLQPLFDRLKAAAERVGAPFPDTVMSGNYWVTGAARDRLREVRGKYYGKTVPAATGVFFAGLKTKTSTAGLELTIAAPDAVDLTVGSLLIDGTRVYKAHRARSDQTITKDGAVVQKRAFTMEKTVIQKDGLPMFRLVIDGIEDTNESHYHSETLLSLRDMSLVYRQDRLAGGLTRTLHVSGRHVTGQEQSPGDSSPKLIDFTNDAPSFYYPFLDAAVNAVTLQGGESFRVSTFDVTNRKTEWHTVRVASEDTVMVKERKVKAWVIEEEREGRLVRKIWLTKEPPFFPRDRTYLPDGSIRETVQTLQ